MTRCPPNPGCPARLQRPGMSVLGPQGPVETAPAGQRDDCAEAPPQMPALEEGPGRPSGPAQSESRTQLLLGEGGWAGLAVLPSVERISIPRSLRPLERAVVLMATAMVLDPQLRHPQRAGAGALSRCRSLALKALAAALTGPFLLVSPGLSPPCPHPTSSPSSGPQPAQPRLSPDTGSQTHHQGD